jgi:hypothetical protein
MNEEGYEGMPIEDIENSFEKYEQPQTYLVLHEKDDGNGKEFFVISHPAGHHDMARAYTKEQVRAQLMRTNDLLQEAYGRLVKNEFDEIIHEDMEVVNEFAQPEYVEAEIVDE